MPRTKYPSEDAIQSETQQRAIGALLYGTRTLYCDLASGQAFIFPTAPEGRAPICRKLSDGWYTLATTGQQFRTCATTNVIPVTL